MAHFPSLWTYKMDTQNIRSHLLKNRLSKWTLTLSFLIGRSFYTYIMDMQNGRSIREGYGMIPCTAGPAISFKCRRKRIGLPPVSGISPVPFHAWRMRHRKCELSRKLRISVTIVENGPMPIFLFGMFFALRISPPEQGSAKRRGACQSRHNPRLFFRYFSASSRAVNRLRLIS